MEEYHKIQSVYKRDEKGDFIIGDWSEPLFGYLAKNRWVYTEKIDGANIRINWDGSRVTFNGRTENSQISSILVNKLQAIFLTDEKKDLFSSKFPGGVTLFGEGYGAKIRKGGGNYISDDVDFILFDVNIDDWYLQRDDVENIAKEFSLDTVPILGNGTLEDMIKACKVGFNSRWGDFAAEGIVARPLTEMKFRNGKRVICKCKIKDFKSTSKREQAAHTKEDGKRLGR